MRIDLGGESLLADLSGALYAPAHRTLIIADMHLEKGSAFLAKGVPLPPFDSAASLARLAALCERYEPRAVIALGDSFHDDDAAARIGEEEMTLLRRLVARHDWIWIMGNHDPRPPAGLGGLHAPSWTLGPLTLRHEPDPHGGSEIAGHLHPVASIHAGGRRIRRRCFAADRRRIVLPAFGAYAGGLNVLDPAIAHLFGADFHAWMIGADALYPIASTRLVPETA